MQRSKKGKCGANKENKVIKNTFKATESSIRVPIGLNLNDANITYKTPSKKTIQGLTKNDLSQENSLARHMQGTTKLSSPNRRATRLLAPTVISRNSKGNIERPTLNRNRSSDLSSSPRINHTHGEHAVKPRQLFPIPLNKVDTKGSHIPQLTKEKALELLKRSTGTTGKENVRSPERKSSLEDYAQKLSSPYKEPEHSIYKLSMSPEGKFQLNIQQTDIESGFDDTSMMEDENDKDFITWKNEQVSKLNGFSFTDI
jgi:protein regulator of cytokinesis 1